MSHPITRSVRPGPAIDEDSAAFWESVRKHELHLERCNECGEVQFPPTPRCPNCGSVSSHPVNVEPKGRVYSWIRVERPLGSITKEEIPCTFAVVDMDVGCRMVGRLDCEEEVVIGQRVVVHFADWFDWTEIRFRNDESAGAL